MQYRFVSIPDGINTQRNIMPLRTEAAKFPFFGVDEAWLHEASAVRGTVRNNQIAGRYTMKRRPSRTGMADLRYGVGGVGVESATAYDKMELSLDETGPVLLTGYPYTWDETKIREGMPIKRKHMMELFEAIARRKYIPSSPTSGGMSTVGTATQTYTWKDDEDGGGHENWSEPEVTTSEHTSLLIWHKWKKKSYNNGSYNVFEKREDTLSNVHAEQNTIVFEGIRREWVSRAACVFVIDVRQEHWREVSGSQTVIDDISETYYHSLNAQISAAGEGISLTVPLAELVGIASAAATKAGAEDEPCQGDPAINTEEYFELKIKAELDYQTIFEIASDYCVPETA